MRPRRSSLALTCTLLIACGDDAGSGSDATASEGTEPPTSDTATTEPVDGCDRDADGVPAIACGGEDCDDDDPAAYPGALDDSWAVEPVDADLLGSAVTTALVRTDDGTLHAIYTDGAETSPTALRHAVRSPDGAWTVDEIATAAALGAPTLVIDSVGDIHVVLAVTDEGSTAIARHGVLQGGSWSFQDVAEGTVDRPAVAIGSDGVLHVAVTGAQTEYWRRDAEGWQSEAVGPLESAIVVLDGTDAPDILGRVGNTLQACVRGESEWSCTDVTPVGDPGPYGLRNRAAYDDAGVLHLVSVDAVDTERLVHRRRMGDTWSTTMLSFLPRPEHGLDMVWAGEVLHVVAWSEALVEGGAAYARWTGGAWSLDEPIIAGDKLGWEPSLVVDPDGAPHVIFADVLFHDLHYAARTAGDGVDQDCDGQDG